MPDAATPEGLPDAPIFAALRVVQRLLHAWPLILAAVLAPRGAGAQPAFGEVPAGPGDQRDAGEAMSGEAMSGGARRFSMPTLERSPGWSVAVQAEAGLAVLTQRDRDDAHALVGGLARLQIGYFEMGGVIEQTDEGVASWRSYGAFVGAFLPFDRWVDVDCSLGANLRRHQDSDRRFGPGGYSLTIPALSLAVGISDRSSEAQLGARLGARLVAAMDMRRRDAAWKYDLVENSPDHLVSGVSRVGGFSISAVVSAGFDVARAPRSVIR